MLSRMEDVFVLLARICPHLSRTGMWPHATLMQVASLLGMQLEGSMASVAGMIGLAVDDATSNEGHCVGLNRAAPS